MIDKELIHQAAEDIDIFEADLSAEYDQMVRPRRVVKLWPIAVAACVAGIVAMLLIPPKDKILTEGYTYYLVVAQMEKLAAPPAQVETVPDHAGPSSSQVIEKQGEETSISHKTKARKTKPQVSEEVPIEEPVQMSEETKMELLMAYLTTTELEQTEINPEEEIQQMRIREGRMLSQMKID